MGKSTVDDWKLQVLDQIGKIKYTPDGKFLKKDGDQEVEIFKILL